MASLLESLSEQGIAAEFRHEPLSDAEGSPLEPVIYLPGHSINSIRLVGAGSGGCSEAGDILRFQYEVRLDSALRREDMPDFAAATTLKNEGGIPFSGRVESIVWHGGQLAQELNRDRV